MSAPNDPGWGRMVEPQMEGTGSRQEYRHFIGIRELTLSRSGCAPSRIHSASTRDSPSPLRSPRGTLSTDLPILVSASQFDLLPRYLRSLPRWGLCFGHQVLISARRRGSPLPRAIYPPKH